MVSAPLTLGSSTTFRPLISWIRRKKSFRSTSFRFTEIGSPVYLGPTAAGCCPACALCSAARFTAGCTPVLEEVLCEACAACALTGSSSAAVLSENFAAASCARSLGSSVASTAAFLGSNVGSTNTKSLVDVAAAFAAIGALDTSITRDANGDTILLAGAGEVSATVLGALEFAAAATCPVCSVSTSFPSADGVSS